MRLIAAVDKNWAIGYQGHLLVSIPADQKCFRQETTGKTVILGRKTMDTFPGGRPLPNRRNIILSHDPAYSVSGAETVNGIDELLRLVGDLPSADVFVIGGESIYRQLLPYCDSALITKIDFAYQADTYFPDLDKDPEWKCIGTSDEQTYYDLEYKFCEYRRI